jgi:hypothetical protein
MNHVCISVSNFVEKLLAGFVAPMRRAAKRLPTSGYLPAAHSGRFSSCGRKMRQASLDPFRIHFPLAGSEDHTRQEPKSMMRVSIFTLAFLMSIVSVAKAQQVT